MTHRNVLIAGAGIAGPACLFETRTGSIAFAAFAAFVRAAFAVELGDFTLTDRLLQETEALTGPIRRDSEERWAGGD
ncbi:DUF6420 family protein [Streptomyces tauricus]